jgi:hypothetical protein
MVQTNANALILGLKNICVALAATESLLVPRLLASQIRHRIPTVVAPGRPFSGYRPAMPVFIPELTAVKACRS